MINQGEFFKALRLLTGMNRKEFSEYLGIPYRTMQEWELGRRHMPEYVLSLVTFRVTTEYGIIEKRGNL